MINTNACLIFSFSGLTNNLKDRPIQNLGNAIKQETVYTNHRAGYNGQGEMEGLKVSSNYIYFSIITNVQGNRANNTDVFRVSKTLLD